MFSSGPSEHAAPGTLKIHPCQTFYMHTCDVLRAGKMKALAAFTTAYRPDLNLTPCTLWIFDASTRILNRSTFAAFCKLAKAQQSASLLSTAARRTLPSMCSGLWASWDWLIFIKRKLIVKQASSIWLPGLFRC